MNEPTLRKPIGILMMLGFVAIWTLIVVAASPWIGALPWPAEALVYLLRFFDHAATADMRRSTEPTIRLGLDWLASRVSPRGIVQTTGNTRSGAGQERDRTGQPRRISGVAVSRAFGLGRTVLDASQFEALAKSVATARQPV